MWFVIFVIIILWILKDVLIGKPNSELAKSREGKLFYTSYYFGGFDDVSVKRNNCVDVSFNNDCIDFNFYKDHSIDIKKSISYNDIIKVKFMNETTISQEVSLGRMVCFGWLGLAMKKEKKNIQEYVVIETKYNDENISIVLEAFFNQNQRLLNEIKNRISNQ